MTLGGRELDHANASPLMENGEHPAPHRISDSVEGNLVDEHP